MAEIGRRLSRGHFSRLQNALDSVAGTFFTSAKRPRESGGHFSKLLLFPETEIGLRYGHMVVVLLYIFHTVAFKLRDTFGV